MRRRRIALVLLAGLLLSAPARAWDSRGHQVVAEIALADLTARTRAAVFALLDADKRPFRLSPEAPPFQAAARWPDDIRDLQRFDRRLRPGDVHAEWHYVNQAFVPDDQRGKPGIRPVRRESPNVITQIGEAVRTLKSKQASRKDRFVMLCWLEHLVGDIHQPLHGITRHTLANGDGDRGGNQFYVLHNGELFNLHAFWDNILDIAGDRGQSVEETARALRAEFPRSRFPALAGPVEDWATESFRLRNAVYFTPEPNPRPLPGTDVEESLRDNPRKTEEVKARLAGTPLPAAYVNRAHRVARERMAMAGYRLADLLNSIFDPGGR